MEVPTGFIEAEANGFFIVTRPVYHKLAVDLAAADPEKVLAGAHAPAGAMEGRGARLELPGEGGDVLILKKQRRGGLYAKLRGDIHRDDYHAVSEVILSETAWKKGVPVALMAFALSAPAGAGRLASHRRAYSASIKLRGARSLMDWLTDPTVTGSGRRAVLRAAAHAVNRAHDRGFEHGDLNLGNILVVKSEQGDHTGWLIDLAHSKLGGTLRPGPRVRNLVRLYRSAEKWLPAATPQEIRRRGRDVVFFLRAYSGREKGQVRRLLAEARRSSASLFLHRLGWKVTRSAGVRRSSAPAGR
ncbi:MAG TPA: lipopolysaccharide kinase InaA family protein [Candidatus Polarisedimenticolia bacterium]|nr:lipopolysaccharide kinase InaA family protein [Candidatus Polarisedimenticolia bacterium]